MLRPFQRQFIAGATRPGIDTAALSLPRGNGKSWLAGHLISRILDPTDKLFRRGTESVLLAASFEQARIVFRFARETLEPAGGYRFQDAANRIGIVHPATNTRLRVISSSGKRAMGLVGTPWAIADEPGSWETVGGELMHDALQTAQGKPGSPLRVTYIGTVAPATAGWWPQMIERGSHGSTYVQVLQGDPKTWDQWQTIRKANPLTMISAKFRAKLLEERDDARVDSRLKARFLSYRLNVPSADESTVLLTVEDWELVLAREVPPPKGRPVVGIDLGGGRAWSAAVAVWPNGRCEAMAVAPGVPDLEAQEKRDRVPRGTYRELVQGGALTLAENLRVPPPKLLWDRIRGTWGPSRQVVSDLFKLNDLRDAVGGRAPLTARRTRWSEAAEDIRALRKSAKDGPLAVANGSRALMVASLAKALVKNDEQGSFRLVKADPSNNSARDDVAAALTLAAGAAARLPKRTARVPRMYVVSAA